MNNQYGGYPAGGYTDPNYGGGYADPNYGGGAYGATPYGGNGYNGYGATQGYTNSIDPGTCACLQACGILACCLACCGCCCPQQ